MRQLITLLVFSITLNSCGQKSAEGYFKEAKNEIDGKRKNELLSKAIEIKPDYFDAIYERACLNADRAMAVKDMIKNGMADKGDDTKLYNDCLKDFETLFKLKPDHAASFFKRGIVQYHMGDNAKACVDLNKALALGYDCSDAINDFCK